MAAMDRDWAQRPRLVAATGHFDKFGMIITEIATATVQAELRP